MSEAAAAVQTDTHTGHHEELAFYINIFYQ